MDLILLMSKIKYLGVSSNEHLKPVSPGNSCGKYHTDTTETVEQTDDI
jgi:hypothetical protein